MLQRFVIPDVSGHRFIEFETADPLLLRGAEELFADLVKRGHSAYRKRAGGDSEHLRKYDAAAEEVVFAPRLVGG